MGQGFTIDEKHQDVLNKMKNETTDNIDNYNNNINDSNNIYNINVIKSRINTN